MTKELIRKALKNIQSRFFTNNLNAQRGFFITQEDADDLRKKVTKPIKSKIYAKWKKN